MARHLMCVILAQSVPISYYTEAFVKTEVVCTVQMCIQSCLNNNLHFTVTLRTVFEDTGEICGGEEQCPQVKLYQHIWLTFKTAKA